jgi:chemotaxis methyl-accepting protein methylase
VTIEVKKPEHSIEEQTKHSIEISNAIIDQTIIQKVAEKMYEKELYQKFQKPYITTWVKQFGHHMYQIKPEEKQDD